MQYIIEGGQRLTGVLQAQGNKNSVFPCMAASLLTDEQVVLENIPQIKDVEVMIQILEKIGVAVEREGSIVKLKAKKLSPILPKDLMIKLRGAIILAGAALGRMGKVKFHHPGGDIIGRRAIDVHLAGFKSLGAKVYQTDLTYKISLKRKISGEVKKIFHTITSVTGTENHILASVLGQDQVIISNCTSEPHVVDLCRMLISMGAKIEGVGTRQLKIIGVKKLHGTKFTISPDYIEIGTFAIASAITRGKIVMKNIDSVDLDPVILPLSEFGIKSKQDKDGICFWAESLKAIPKLITNIWPGFPTDLMSVSIVLATQAEGVTLCHDWIYESRMFFVDKLIAMGANVTIADPHRVLVYGPTQLRSRSLESPDIRAGMALVLASLVAKGISTIQNIELIERGYEDVEQKLKKLGAKIKRG